MITVTSVLSELGGPQKVAELLEVTLQAVCNMKARGSIPSRHWATLVAEGKKRRKPAITFENLAAIQKAA